MLVRVSAVDEKDIGGGTMLQFRIFFASRRLFLWLVRTYERRLNIVKLKSYNEQIIRICGMSRVRGKGEERGRHECGKHVQEDEKFWESILGTGNGLLSWFSQKSTLVPRNNERETCSRIRPEENEQALKRWVDHTVNRLQKYVAKFDL